MRLTIESIPELRRKVNAFVELFGYMPTILVQGYFEDRLHNLVCLDRMFYTVQSYDKQYLTILDPDYRTPFIVRFREAIQCTLVQA